MGKRRFIQESRTGHYALNAFGVHTQIPIYGSTCLQLESPSESTTCSEFMVQVVQAMARAATKSLPLAVAHRVRFLYLGTRE